LRKRREVSSENKRVGCIKQGSWGYRERGREKG